MVVAAAAAAAMAIKMAWEEAGDFKSCKFYREHHPFETRV